MTPEALFTAALQLEAGWEVSECRFEGEPRRLLLKLDFEQGKRFSCPQCGKLCPTHDTSTKRWRHLNFLQYELLLGSAGAAQQLSGARGLERGGTLGAGR
jgi:transposase